MTTPTGENPTQGEGTPAEPKPGQPTPTEPPSPTTADLLNQIKRLEGRVASLQSDKDKRVTAVATEVETWKPVLEQVKALMTAGVTDPAQIERELEFAELKRRVLGEPTSTPPATSASGNGAGAGQEDTVLQVAQKLELPTDDEEVATILRSQKGAEAIAALTLLKVERAKSPEPTPGAGPAIPGGGVPKPGARDISGITSSKELYAIAASDIAKNKRR